MLHFRSFLITGLMVGAVVFLPHNAFAEKNDPSPSGKLFPQKAAVQAHNTDVQAHNTDVQAHNTDVQKGKAVVVPHPAVKSVGKTLPPKAASQKPAAVPQKVAAKARGKGLSGLGNNEKTVKADKAVKAPVLDKEAVVKEKNKPAPQNGVVKSAIKSLPHRDIEVETKAQRARSVNRIQPQRETAQSTVSKYEPTVPPRPLKKEKAPVSKEELPKISQMLNQTQRTNSSGGDSNERVSHGSSTINGVDKWLEWDVYQQSQLVQLYVSRQTFIQNQWTNAPPSPPPQEAPFFKNVTRR